MTKTSKLRWLMIAGLIAVFGLSACDRKEREEAKQDAERDGCDCDAHVVGRQTLHASERIRRRGVLRCDSHHEITS